MQRRPVIQIPILARRRWILAVLVPVIVVAAVVIGFAVRGSSSSASVEFVLGGGTVDSGSGPQRKVSGELQSMTADEHGNVVLFTRDSQGYELWTADPGGAVKRVRVPALDSFGTGALDQAAQAAAAPDGSLYLALGAGGLWRVTREGHATKVVGAPRERSLTDKMPPEQFSPLSVNGIAVAGDGTVFFSDLQNQRGSLLVHRLRAGQVTRIAGRPLRATQKTPNEDPNLLDPRTGGPAEDTYLPEIFSATPLAWKEGTLYVHTGRGILRIATATERIYPVVAARDTTSLERPDSPFKPFGRAINGYVDAPRGGDSYHLSSIAVDRATGDLYYGAGDPRPGGTTGISAKFRWSGDLTKSQRNFFASLRNAQQTVYQVGRNGDLSAVTAGAEALATGDGYLYLAVDTCPSDEAKCDATSYESAVVRLRLPTAKN